MYKRVLTIILVYIPAGFVVASVMLVTILKWVPVTVTPLMVKRSIESIGGPHRPFQRTWVPLESISNNMICAVIAAEDQKFLHHHGFDYDELSKMKQEHMFDGTPIRGCSTISQQTAKNCFTFCSHTWLRKGIEVYYTVLIEWIWGKERIMEVYLNSIEMGDGIYGAEAVAQEHFGKHASALNKRQSALIAASLPNPITRDSANPSRYMRKRSRQIVRLMRLIEDPKMGCEVQ